MKKEPAEFEAVFNTLADFAMRESLSRDVRWRFVLARQWMLERERFREALEKLEKLPTSLPAHRIIREALAVIR